MDLIASTGPRWVTSFLPLYDPPALKLVSSRQLSKAQRQIRWQARRLISLLEGSLLDTNLKWTSMLFPPDPTPARSSLPLAPFATHLFPTKWDAKDPQPRRSLNSSVPSARSTPPHPGFDSFQLAIFSLSAESERRDSVHNSSEGWHSLRHSRFSTAVSFPFSRSRMSSYANVARVTYLPMFFPHIFTVPFFSSHNLFVQPLPTVHMKTPLSYALSTLFSVAVLRHHLPWRERLRSTPGQLHGFRTRIRNVSAAPEWN